MKKIILSPKLLAVSALTLGVSATAFAFAASPMNTQNPQAIHNAIANRDLAAYKSAVTDGATKQAQSMTQEQLNTIADRQAQRDTMRKAIENNDYEAFKNARSTNGKHIPTQEEFNQLVTRHANQKEVHTKVQEAIKNNDFAAFKSAVENRGMGKVRNQNPSTTVQTREAHMQERFNQLVADYKATGNLPEISSQQGGKGTMGQGGFKGLKGHKNNFLRQ